MLLTIYAHLPSVHGGHGHLGIQWILFLLAPLSIPVVKNTSTQPCLVQVHQCETASPGVRLVILDDWTAVRFLLLQTTFILSAFNNQSVNTWIKSCSSSVRNKNLPDLLEAPLDPWPPSLLEYLWVPSHPKSIQQRNSSVNKIKEVSMADRARCSLTISPVLPFSPEGPPTNTVSPCDTQCSFKH